MKMISRRDFMKASAVVGATAALTACGGGDSSSTASSASSAAPASSAPAASESAAGGATIGICIYQFADNFMTLYRADLEEYLGELGYSVTIMDGKNDQSTQTEQINTFLQQGVDVLIINPVQTTSAQTIVDTVSPSGIPIVFIIAVISIILPQPRTCISSNSRVGNRPKQISFIYLIIQFLVGNNRPMIENIVARSTLIPVASSIQIRTTLLIPSRQIISFSPFIRLTTASKTPRNTSQFRLSPFFQIQFPSTFISNVTDSYSSKHLFGISTTTNYVHILCSANRVTLVELSLSAK